MIDRRRIETLRAELEEAKRDFAQAETAEDRQDAREAVNELNRALFLAGDVGEAA